MQVGRKEAELPNQISSDETWATASCLYGDDPGEMAALAALFTSWIDMTDAVRNEAVELRHGTTQAVKCPLVARSPCLEA